MIRRKYLFKRLRIAVVLSCNMITTKKWQNLKHIGESSIFFFFFITITADVFHNWEHIKQICHNTESL